MTKNYDKFEINGLRDVNIKKSSKICNTGHVFKTSFKFSNISEKNLLKQINSELYVVVEL